MELTSVFRWIVLPSVLLGFMLHAYTCFFMADSGASGFTVGLFLLSTLPYLACLLVGVRKTRGALMAACAIPLLLIFDISAFTEAFVSPTTSTSSLVLLVAPVINLVVMVLGFLIGGLVFATMRRNASKERR